MKFLFNVRCFIHYTKNAICTYYDVYIFSCFILGDFFILELALVWVWVVLLLDLLLVLLVMLVSEVQHNSQDSSLAWSLSSFLLKYLGCTGSLLPLYSQPSPKFCGTKVYMGRFFSQTVVIYIDCTWVKLRVYAWFFLSPFSVSP